MELAAARWTPGPADRAQAVAPAPSRAAWCLPPAALAAARRRAAAPDRGAPGAPAAAAAALAAPQRRRQRQRPRLAPAAAGSNNGVTTHGGAGDAAHAATQQLGSQDAQTDRVWTKFVAETLLPTKQGKFRLRGYRHTVRACGCCCRLPLVLVVGQAWCNTGFMRRVASERRVTPRLLPPGACWQFTARAAAAAHCRALPHPAAHSPLSCCRWTAG